jgi:hypothetical protein
MSTRLTVKKVILFGFFILSAFLFFSLKSADAQTASSPQFLITWKASNSYIPSFYTGKALPTQGSKITASLELISNGHILDLSSQNIYWYVDEVLVGGGAGVQQVTFPPFGTPPGSLILEVDLPQYSSGYLIHSINIPFVEPMAVIDAPYPNQEFSTNLLTVQGIPFFFYATSSDNLSFSWSVNGQAGSNAENPQVADITLPQGTPGGTNIGVSLSVEDPVGSTVATANQNLTFQNQL